MHPPTERGAGLFQAGPAMTLGSRPAPAQHLPMFFVALNQPLTSRSWPSSGTKAREKVHFAKSARLTCMALERAYSYECPFVAGGYCVQGNPAFLFTGEAEAPHAGLVPSGTSTRHNYANGRWTEQWRSASLSLKQRGHPSAPPRWRNLAGAPSPNASHPIRAAAQARACRCSFTSWTRRMLAPWSRAAV